MRFAAFTLLIATMVAEYVALPLHPPSIPLDQCQGFSFFFLKKKKKVHIGRQLLLQISDTLPTSSPSSSPSHPASIEEKKTVTDLPKTL